MRASATKYSANTSNSSEGKPAAAPRRFQIRHVTRFAYDQPAYESHNEVRLKPREAPGQHTLGFRLDITPAAAIVEYNDSFGNIVHALSIHDPHRELVIFADSLVELEPSYNADAGNYRFSEFLAGDHLRSQEEYDYLHQSRYIPFSDQLKKFFWMMHPRMDQPVAAYIQQVVEWVHGQFAYEPGTTQVHSDVNEILSAGAGVCQDFAHLTIGLLRLAGVPARYVSGYLAPPSENGRQRPLGAQASHAWFEALLPEADWTGFDPTHGCRTGDHHVRVAVGRDYGDVAPVRGVFRGTGTSQIMRVSLDVTEVEGPENSPMDPGATQQ